ncbi:MAG: hypothetical protein ABIR34_12470 [Marmoricola sp.]
MPEKLAQLMRDEADAMRVPAPTPETILRAGRGVRRRRQLLQATGTLAVLGAVVAAGLTVIPRNSTELTAQQRFDRAAPAAAYSEYGAFSAGKVVYVGNHRVKFDQLIKAIYYTSEGVLVRAGRSAATDSAGPSRYTLIRPDGSVTNVALRMGDRVAGTDPDSPNVAYAAPTGDPERWDMVVMNVVTGKQVASTTVTGKFTWGGWEAPPMDLQGSRMWAHFDDGWLEYDWHTGATRMVPGTNRTFETAHGRYVVQNRTQWTVHDFVSGDQVSQLRVTPDTYGFFSPDGRYLRFSDQMAVIGEDATKAPRPKFFDVTTGRTHSISRVAEQYGWTPDGKTLVVDARKDSVTVCNPGSGSCETVHLAIADRAVKLGGEPYES